jgi:hypothetical protein
MKSTKFDTDANLFTTEGIVRKRHNAVRKFRGKAEGVIRHIEQDRINAKRRALVEDMKKAKEQRLREPTLADYFIAEQANMMDKAVGEKTIAALQAKARQAHKFVFDEEASIRVGEVVRDIPDLIIREAQFARAPFEVTWIEYDAFHFWSTVNGREPDEKSDTKVGFLIDHNRVNVVAMGEEDKRRTHTGLYPIAYHLNTEWPVEDQLRFAHNASTSRMGLDFWMWGETAGKLLQAGETDKLRALRDSHMAEFILRPDFLANLVKRNRLVGFLDKSAGDMRNMIAFLLMLNRPSIVQYKNTLPKWHGFIGNKVKPFFSHTTVNVSLDAVAVLNLVGTPKGEEVGRRRHEVRGHYCHDKGARDYMRIAGCIHDWQPTHKDWTPWPDAKADEADNWRCGTCDGKRWWRAEHHRGTAQTGFVINDGYQVTNGG